MFTKLYEWLGAKIYAYYAHGLITKYRVAHISHARTLPLVTHAACPFEKEGDYMMDYAPFFD